MLHRLLWFQNIFIMITKFIILRNQNDKINTKCRQSVPVAQYINYHFTKKAGNVRERRKT